jgi:peptide/nickel transport system substrate-binding protein
VNGGDAIDYNQNYSRRSMEVYRNVLGYPLRYPPKAEGQLFVSDFSKVVGMMAKEWTVSPDYSKITITLKEGVMSPTGHELTADDVLYRNSANWALKGPGYGFNKDAMLLESEQAFQKLGKYTYSIQSSRPNYLVEIIHAHNAEGIIDSAEYKAHATADDPWAGKWAAGNVAGFGPWKVTERVAGQSWTFERNQNYFDPAEYSGNVTKVINRVIPSSANRVALLQSGDLDLAFDLEASELKSLESAPGVRVDHLSGNMIQWLGWAMKSKENPELQDVNVRMAISWALPYKDIVERPYLGTATQMECTVAPSYQGHDMVSKVWDTTKPNMAKAKEFMAKSKFANGFKTKLHFDGPQPGVEESAVLIRSALAELGIQVELQKMQTGDFYNMAIAMAYPGLFIYTDMCGTPDPSFGSHLYLKTGGVENHGLYSNAELDALYAQAQSQPGDINKRIDLQRQLEDIAWNKDPWGAPLQYLGFHGAARQNVGGWWWHSLQELMWSKAFKN